MVARNGICALFSPIPESRRILSQEFGRNFKVDYLIAPTAHHDTFFADCADLFPEAVCLTSPDFRQGMVSSTSLPEGFPEAWREIFKVFLLEGMPGVGEVVFFDVENRALIVSDFIFYFDEKWDMWSKIGCRLLGCYGSAGMSYPFKFLIKDRAIFQNALLPLLTLDIHQIIPSHGKVISGDCVGILKGIYEKMS